VLGGCPGTTIIPKSIDTKSFGSTTMAACAELVEVHRRAGDCGSVFSVREKFEFGQGALDGTVCACCPEEGMLGDMIHGDLTLEDRDGWSVYRLGGGGGGGGGGDGGGGDGGDASGDGEAAASGGGSSVYPWTIGLTADLGQTEVSLANAELLRTRLQGSGSLVLLAGDLSYADGFYSRWDSYARLMQPLAATVPVMSCGGNHEVGTAEAWVSYNTRYPMPYRSSGSPSNLWWSRAVGPLHLISLSSYAATEAGSLQHAWLVRDLAAVDRAATPWLVVMMHAPWYNSNSGHAGEAELMRRDMEPLLFEAGVDLVLSGQTTLRNNRDAH